jgi:hypothetical protein
MALKISGSTFTNNKIGISMPSSADIEIKDTVFDNNGKAIDVRSLNYLIEDAIREINASKIEDEDKVTLNSKIESLAQSTSQPQRLRQILQDLSISATLLSQAPNAYKAVTNVIEYLQAFL